MLGYSFLGLNTEQSPLAIVCGTTFFEKRVIWTAYPDDVGKRVVISSTTSHMA